MGVKETQSPEETKHETSSSSFSSEEEEEKHNQKNQYKINEKLDVLDRKGQWVDGEVVAIREKEVRVHFTGLKSKYDEWILIKSPRIVKRWNKSRSLMIGNRVDVFYENEWIEGYVADIGVSHAKIRFPSSKSEFFLPKNSSLLLPLYSCSSSMLPSPSPNSESLFLSALTVKGLTIKLIEGDGNCLFRAVSDQIYGEEGFYGQIRRYCVEYLEIEEEFFKNYISGDFKEYCKRKRNDGVWGDDIEIQVLSEIYNRSVEIYAYSNEPMRTFHEGGGERARNVIRLSYHGGNHYNSVVRVGRKEENKEIFGQIEESALKAALHRNNTSKHHKSKFSDPTELAIQLSRTEFELLGKRDMESALKESLLLFHEKEKEIQEKSILQQAIKDSLEAVEKETNKISLSTIQNYQTSTINRLMEEGFPLEIALQAVSIVGEDFESALRFIYENLV